MGSINRFFRDESGVTALQVGLTALLIGVFVDTALTTARAVWFR